MANGTDGVNPRAGGRGDYMVVVTDEQGVEMECVTDGFPLSFDSYEAAVEHKTLMEGRAAGFGRDVTYRIERASREIAEGER